MPKSKSFHSGVNLMFIFDSKAAAVHSFSVTLDGQTKESSKRLRSLRLTQDVGDSLRKIARTFIFLVRS